MDTRPIADPDLEAYAAAHSSPEPHWLRTAAEATRAGTDSPGMMVGHLVGRFLGMLVAFGRPQRILEFGTFTGYSALSMAEALPPGGRITSLELNPRHVALARSHIAASPHADRIEVIEGPALDSVGRLGGPFDLVFIDADKPGYIGYYEAALPLLSPHALLVADNVLWDGRVLDPVDDTTRAIVAFNEHVAADPRVERVMLTLRDGMTLVRKRA